MMPLTEQQLQEIRGGFEFEIKANELLVIYENEVVPFGWPMTWSTELLQWHILDRFGLRNPDLRPRH